MFNVGTGEVLVILLLALIVLGPDKLPDTARKIGNVLGELRRMSHGFQSEIRTAFDEAVNTDNAQSTPASPTRATESEPAARSDDPAA
jgi:Tat protein translocase TatB subunit